MQVTARTAVSPIIATLLLIAIAVAAGIIVYVYVNRLAGGLTSGGGQQVAAQVQLEAYTFSAIGSGSGKAINNFVTNAGRVCIAIRAIDVDGTATAQGTPSLAAFAHL